MAGPVLFTWLTNLRSSFHIQTIVKLVSSILLVLVAVTVAMATPIRPDIKKLLATPQTKQHFVPARVDWNGPEAASVSPDLSPAMERFGPAGLQRLTRESLIQVATPDWRIFLGLGALIFLLRILKNREMLARVPARYPTLVDAVEPKAQRPAA